MGKMTLPCSYQFYLSKSPESKIDCPAFCGYN